MLKRNAHKYSHSGANKFYFEDEKLHPSSSTFITVLTWMKRILFGVLALACIKFFFFLEPVPLQERETFFNKTMVEFGTEYGSFVVELLEQDAPLTIDYFLQNVDEGFYSNQKTGFYRFEKDVLLQGGGFVHRSEPRNIKRLPVEYKQSSIARSVVLTRGKDANSGGTEFAIMLGDNTKRNAPTVNNPGYTTFGHVYSGWKSIEKISRNMKEGFLSREDVKDVILFQKTQKVHRVIPSDPQLRPILQSIMDHIEKDYSVVIFSKTFCPYSKKAKDIFLEMKAQLHVVELDELPDGGKYQNVLEILTGRRTVPNVFIRGKSIGGGDDTQLLFTQGKLEPMVQEMGALAPHFVLNTLSHHPIVVFGKSYCPFSKKAELKLTAVKATFVMFHLDLRNDGAAIQSYLEQLTGRKTVPNVFIRGESVGGGDDVAALYESGELKHLVEEAGALE